MSKGYREEWEVHVKIKKEREEKNTKLSMSEKSYISRVPYLYYGALNIRSKINETLIQYVQR